MITAHMARWHRPRPGFRSPAAAAQEAEEIIRKLDSEALQEGLMEAAGRCTGDRAVSMVRINNPLMLIPCSFGKYNFDPEW